MVLAPLLQRAQAGVDVLRRQAPHSEAIEQAAHHGDRVGRDELEGHPCSARLCDLRYQSVACVEMEQSELDGRVQAFRMGGPTEGGAGVTVATFRGAST